MEEDEIFENEMAMDSVEANAIEDMDEDNYSDPLAGTVVGLVQDHYTKASTARENEEKRWVQAYRNYRGLYGPDVQFTSTEKSRVFVKVTKTKVLAAYGQIVDVLFGNSKFPITVDPTTLPEGVADSVFFESNDDMRKAKEEFGPEDMQLRPGETVIDLQERLAGSKSKLAPVVDILEEGNGRTATEITIHPAMISAKKMEKKIHDQLEESNANKQLRVAAFECALFGTGVMKGPFAVDKEYPKYEEGEYTPLIKTVPQTSSVSIWNFYPDPDAANMDEAEYVIERHKMSRTQIRALKRRPFFRKNAIDTAVNMGESYTKEWWEQAMEDDSNESKAERYEVLEFWGNVDTEVLEGHDVDIPSDLKDLDQVSVNIWICNGQVLRLVMNPFTPTLIPYYAVPYEVSPYSLFGIGIAENMDDTQTLMNGFMRMAVDNAALSGNMIIEVDETNLTPGQDLSVYPGKVFRRQGGAPGQAIFGTKFPNVSNENMQMFDKARVLSDESTGFPSFAHGQTGVSGVGRTASGISMLMSAANGSIRNVVKNVDDYLLGPLAKAFFNFNMQFDYDEEIKGDLDVKARGTESLMANEVRSQRLMQFLQVVQNPVLAPFAKMDYIIREIAKSMDLDPDKLVNSMSDATIQAEMLKKWQEANPPEPQPEAPGQPQGGPAGAQAGDPTGAGGGTIGTGSVPTPGEPGFSANTGQGAA
ncbi:MAG: hypothetical protein CMJ25_26005 [Phycisphaerae bacterium]|nr:hypothetical protein [Phycisphaerae bacterium]